MNNATAATTLATLGLGLALSLAFPGQARADRYEVGLGGGAHFVPMESMDSVSEERSFGIFSMHLGLKLPELAVLSGFESEVGLDWDFGELDGSTFNRIASELEMDALMARARLRRQLRGPFSAFADAGLGIQWAKLRLEDERAGNARPLAGKAKAALSSLGGGAEIRIIDDPRVKFSLRTQVHYQVATSMSFDATPMKAGEDKLEIATESASLGSINTTGLVFRAGFVGSF
jgi:opacity protein-like surface antigen